MLCNQNALRILGNRSTFSVKQLNKHLLHTNNQLTVESALLQLEEVETPAEQPKENMVSL